MKSTPKKKINGTKVPTRYLKKGNTSQNKKMAYEIKKFKNASGGTGYHTWQADKDAKGKKYKTKPSKHTVAFKRKFGK